MKRVITHEDAKELFTYLSGKTISLVGNAQSLLEKEQGELIDSSDVVMRINRGYPVDFKRHGTKTNVVWMNNRFVGDKVISDYLRTSKFFYYVLEGGNNKSEIESCLIKGDIYNWNDVWNIHKPEMKFGPVAESSEGLIKKVQVDTYADTNTQTAKREVRYTVTPDPITAGPEDDFGFSETTTFFSDSSTYSPTRQEDLK